LGGVTAVVATVVAALVAAGVGVLSSSSLPQAARRIADASTTEVSDPTRRHG
jgi:hypothetical protein